MRRACAAFGLLASLLLVAAARAEEPALRSAQKLRDGRRAAHDFDFTRAISLLHQALAAGDAPPELVWQIYWWMGQATAGAGLPDAAEEAFTRALELHPAMQLQADASPRLTEPFTKARARLGDARLETQVSAQASVDGMVRLKAVVRNDVAHLVESAQAHPLPRDGNAVVELARTDVLEGRWHCAVSPCAFYVALKDASGNEVAWVGSEAAPLYAESDAPVAKVRQVPAPLVMRGTPDPVLTVPASRASPLALEASARPWYRRGWPYLVGAGIFLAASAVLTAEAVHADAQARAIPAEPSQHYFRDLQEADRARKLDTALAGSGAGLAVGLGVVSAVEW